MISLHSVKKKKSITPGLATLVSNLKEKNFILNNVREQRVIRTDHCPQAQKRQNYEAVRLCVTVYNFMDYFCASVHNTCTSVRMCVMHSLRRDC